MSEVTPQQLIESLTKFKEECHSNMEGCDLYEFLHWERGMVLAREIIEYIGRDSPWLYETYDNLMDLKCYTSDELLKIIAEKKNEKAKS